MARFKGNFLTFLRNALFFCLFLTFAGGTVGKKTKQGKLGHPPKSRSPWHLSSPVKEGRSQDANNRPFSLQDILVPRKKINKETPLVKRQRPHNGQHHKAKGVEQNKMQRPDSQQPLKGGQRPHRHNGDGEINMQTTISPTTAEKTKGEEHTRKQKIPLKKVQGRFEIQRPHQHKKQQTNTEEPHQTVGQTTKKKPKSKHSQTTADDELIESRSHEQTTERTFIQRHNQTREKIKIQRANQTIDKTKTERPEHQTILLTKIMERPTADYQTTEQRRHHSKSTEPTEVLKPHHNHTTESTKMQRSHSPKTTQQSNMQSLKTTDETQIPHHQTITKQTKVQRSQTTDETQIPHHQTITEQTKVQRPQTTDETQIAHHQTITEQTKVQRPQTTEQTKMYGPPENQTAQPDVIQNLLQTTEQTEIQTSRHFKTTEPSKIRKTKKNGNDSTKVKKPEKHKSKEKMKKHKQKVADVLNAIVGIKKVAKKNKKKENHKKEDHNGFIKVPDETLTEENSPQEEKPREKKKKHHHGEKATGKSHKGGSKFHKPEEVEDDPEVEELEKELEKLDKPTKKKKKTKKLFEKGGPKIESVEKGREDNELTNEADRVYNIIDKVQKYASKLRHPTVHITDDEEKEQLELQKLMKLGQHPTKVNLHMLEGQGSLLGDSQMIPFKIESLETSNPEFKTIDETDPLTSVIEIEAEPVKEEPKTEAPMTVLVKETEESIQWQEAITSTQPPPPPRKVDVCKSNPVYRLILEGIMVFALIAIITVIIGIILYKKQLLKGRPLKEFSFSSDKNDNYGGKVSGLHRSRKDSRYIVSVLDESRRSDSDSTWSSDDEEEEIFDVSTLKSDSPIVAQGPSSKLKRSLTSTPVKKKLIKK